MDASQFALAAFPGGVPEFSVEPGDSGDESIGLDGAENGSRFRIDLMDFSIAILAHPECAFGPGESGVTAAAGSGDGREDFAVFGSIFWMRSSAS